MSEADKKAPMSATLCRHIGTDHWEIASGREIRGWAEKADYLRVDLAESAHKAAIQEAVAAARAEERERCARIAEGHAPMTQSWQCSDIAERCFAIAAAIRTTEQEGEG